MQAAFNALSQPLGEERQDALVQHARTQLKAAKEAGGETDHLVSCLDTFDGTTEVTLLDALVAAYVLNGGIILADRPVSESPAPTPPEEATEPPVETDTDLQNLISELDKDFLA